MHIPPQDYSFEERLRDGLCITVRAVRHDDRDRLHAAFRALQPHSVYRRLFMHKAELTEADLVRLTQIDFETEVCLVATLRKGGEESIIGSGRYFAFRHADGTCHAEVAFLVADEFQGQGLAGILLQHLATLARSQGIACFQAEVLLENKAMLRVFSRSGLPMSQSGEQGVIHVRLSLKEARQQQGGP
jgi:RimJ/RimL family protein N-acetyltransferase